MIRNISYTILSILLRLMLNKNFFINLLNLNIDLINLIFKLIFMNMILLLLDLRVYIFYFYNLKVKSFISEQILDKIIINNKENKLNNFFDLFSLNV